MCNAKCNIVSNLECIVHSLIVLRIKYYFGRLIFGWIPKTLLSFRFDHTQSLKHLYQTAIHGTRQSYQKCQIHQLKKSGNLSNWDRACQPSWTRSPDSPTCNIVIEDPVLLAFFLKGLINYATSKENNLKNILGPTRGGSTFFKSFRQSVKIRHCNLKTKIINQ